MPSVAVQSTFTNNVTLSSDRTSDWVNELTPGIHFTEEGAHSRLDGTVAVPVILYTRTAAENNYVAPEVNVSGRFEAIERLFFVEASANVTQPYLTPFAGHPNELTSATQNRYTAQVYRVSPYIKGDAPDGVDYELRQTNLWTDANASGIANGRAYTNEVSGHVAREPRPFGWALEIDRTDTDFRAAENTETTQVARVRGLYQFTPEVRLSVTGGYEDNHFFGVRERGATYGTGVHWHPSDRTTVDADWEHRFFGSSYNVVANHRTPLSTWSFRASRDVSTFPQQLAQLGAGVDIASLLNGLFASRVTDPAERQTLVDQLIRNRGLPSTLTSPIALFAEQVTLLESQTATVGLIGARNTVFFTAYRSKSEPIDQANLAGVSQLLLDLTDETQVGANAVYTHRLAPNVALSAGLDWSRAHSNTQSGATSRQYSLRIVVSTALSALTTGFVGARYQDFRTDVFTSYQEAALFVGLSHLFH